ncbi:DeoR family transcriptional regulator, partial [Klebsiella michiganensis]
PYPLGPIGRFNRIITDDNLNDAVHNQLTQCGLTVDIVNHP